MSEGLEVRGAGRLVVVGTPIGNLSDMSDRGKEILRAADLVACEDSRRTGRLIQLLGLAKKSMMVVNDHTERDAVGRIVDSVSRGDTVALVSDAGMPTISDPGYLAVAAVREAGLAVSVVPGPTSVAAALSISGFAASRFVFEGFLPRRGAERLARLELIRSETRPVVLFEAPHRLRKTLSDLVEIRGGDGLVAIVRELTKMHEEVRHGPLSDLVRHFGEVEPRGEFVVVLDGAVPVEIGEVEVREMLERCLIDGASRRDAVEQVRRLSGRPKREVYDVALRLEF